jgi:hypothetical protein
VILAGGGEEEVGRDTGAARSKAKKGVIFSGTVHRSCDREVRSKGGGEVLGIDGGELGFDMGGDSGPGDVFLPMIFPTSFGTSTMTSPTANDDVCGVNPCVDPWSCVYV